MAPRERVPHPPAMRRRRAVRALLLAAGVAVLLPLALLAFVATFDWNRAKPWLVARAGEATGRAIAVDGDLEVAWRWRRGDGEGAAWSPGLHVRASGVRIANADWARSPSAATFDRLDADLSAWPLLWHRIDLARIEVEGPRIDVERRADGSDNWTLEHGGDAGSWSVAVGDVVLGAGEIDIRDARRKLDLHATIEPLAAPIAFGERVAGDDPSTRRDVIGFVGKAAAQRLREAAREREQRRAERGTSVKPPPYRFAFTAKGTLAGMDLAARGRFGGVLALRRPEPFPLRADFDVGSTQIALTGTITDPASPDAVDMRLWISGRNLAHLYDILGIALPKSPPYATVGRLAGRFDPSRTVLRYEDFTARVGGSDLSGTLTYRSGEPRPTLSGEVDSTLLRLRDLGAVVGAGSAEERAARGDRIAQPAGRVLPAAPFDVERWRAADADVHFTGKRVIRNEDQPITGVETRIRMQDGTLALEPLRFGMAGGRVDGLVRIDSGPSPAKGAVKLSARKLALARL
ncbi:MAG TPA: AsmA family protein, partial [Dokdonella sp.]|nr:AsmA family protein [Dokdonella sp.]